MLGYLGVVSGVFWGMLGLFWGCIGACRDATGGI